MSKETASSMSVVVTPGEEFVTYITDASKGEATTFSHTVTELRLREIAADHTRRSVTRAIHWLQRMADPTCRTSVIDYGLAFPPAVELPATKEAPYKYRLEHMGAIVQYAGELAVRAEAAGVHKENTTTVSFGARSLAVVQTLSDYHRSYMDRLRLAQPVHSLGT